jgi:hypothetical protein
LLSFRRHISANRCDDPPDGVREALVEIYELRNRQLPALSLQVPHLGNLLPEQIKFRRNPLLDRQLIQS